MRYMSYVLYMSILWIAWNHSSHWIALDIILLFSKTFQKIYEDGKSKL